MAGYTNNYDIPYPTPGDPITQGAAKIREGFERVDEALSIVGGSATPPITVAAPTSPIQAIPSAVVTEHPLTAVMHIGGNMAQPNGRLLIPKKGVYDIRLTGSFAANTTGYRAAYCYRYRGANKKAVCTVRSSPPNGTFWIESKTVLWPLEAGDELAYALYQNSGGDLLHYRAAVDSDYIGITAQFARTWTGNPV